VDQPVNKIVFCCALICPIVTITALSIFLINIIPQYGHYILFIMSVNIGISIIDLLYLKIILFTKKGTYIEERKNGIELLTKRSLNTEHLYDIFCNQFPKCAIFIIVFLQKEF